MTKIFQKIIFLAAIVFGGILNASCPPNYTTSTLTLDNVTFNVCYPSVVNLTLNSGQFNIYVSIANNNGADRQVTATGYLPNLLGLDTLINSGCPPSVATGTCDGITAGGINGKGRMVYPVGTPLGAGLTTTLTATMQATAAGTYTYTPAAVVQPTFVGSLPDITITVVNTPCSTIVASNGVGATACSNSVSSGNLNNFVTGGNSPYSFVVANATNGTVGLAGDIYTFDPNITSGNGTFDYQAFDIPGCPSNTGTITVPIVSSPVGGDDVYYYTDFGTPVVQQLNFTGGVAPFTITTNNIVNGNVVYDQNTAQFTFTQLAPGASFFDYTVTDANGCTTGVTPNVYIYSCNPGYTAATSSGLFNNVIYSICAPSTVSFGSTFEITITMTNPNLVGLTPTVFPMQDVVPDPSQGFAPGLLYVSNDGAPVGTTFVSTGVSLGQGGMGTFSVDSGDLPPNTSYSITTNIQATASGMQTYTARIPSNPNLTFTVNINVLPCTAITGASTGISSCNNVVVGDLSGLVDGALPPVTFAQTGIATCGEVTVLPAGAFIYTAPAGFFGPCSFDYYATGSDGCPSNVATVTITANLGPVAFDGAGTTCENGTFEGFLSANAGTPPYTFSIVTNGTLGTVTLINPQNGLFSYIPNPDVFGNDFFTFQVTDSLGCVSNIAQFNITITESPTTAAISLTGCLNSSISGDLAAFVSGGTLPYTFNDNTPAVGGTVTIAANGPFTFTPNVGFSGLGGFDYIVVDAVNCVASGIVDITVDSFAGSNVSLATCNSFYIGSLTNFLTGGTGPLSFSGPLVTTCGNVTIAPDGGFIYTAPSGFSGPCDFGYSATDGLGCTVTGVVTVTANVVPAVNNDAIALCENSSVSGTLATLIVGQLQPPLTFIIVTPPTNGTLTSFDSATGAYTYAPDADFNGVDSFQFVVTDSGVPPCTTSIGTVTITVNAVPVVVGSLLIPCANQPISDSLAGLVQGNPPAPLTFELVVLPLFGTITNFNPSTGAYTYTPNTGFVGLDAFQFQVTDANGCVSNIGIITVDVIQCCPLSNDPVMQLILQQFWGTTGATWYKWTVGIKSLGLSI